MADVGPFGSVLATLARRWKLFGALLVCTIAVLAFGARDIGIDNSLKIWYLEGDETLEAWHEFQEQFGNDEIIIVAATDPVSVFEPAALERVRTASRQIEDHAKIRRVTSIGISRHIEGDAFEIRTEPLLADGPVDREGAAAARRRVSDNPIFAGNIVSENDKITLILVELEHLDDVDAERPELLDDVRAIAKAELSSGGGTFHMSGMGVVYEGLNAASLRDSQVFSSLAYLVVLIGLWLMFRSLLWVFVGAVVVSLATAVTVGVSGLAGRDLNMVTAVLPTLLMTVGILDLVHLIDAYREQRPDGSPSRGVVMRSGALILIPCAFNSLTDIAGFSSLAAAEMSAIRDFGWLAAVGLGALFVVLFVVAIPILTRYGCRPRGAAQGGRRLAAVMTWMFGIVRRRRRALLWSAPLLLAAAIGGIAMLSVDTYTIGFLGEDNPVRRDHDTIEAQFGPFIPYDFVVTAGPGQLKEPEVLRRLERAERSAEQLPEIARATALVEIVSRLNQVVMDGDPAARVIPARRDIIAQELLLYETDEENEIERLADPDYGVARLTARAGMPSGRGIGRNIALVEERVQRELGDSARVEGVGYMAVNSHVLERITATQIRTFSIAFIIIALGMMLVFRSVRLGLVALVPNLLPVAMTLGFMGYAGIRLDVATVLIASIMIGIAVNDTTHILFRFRHELRKSPADVEAAVRRMMLGTGRAVVGSSLILIAGFSVLLFAQVKSIILFGMLCSIAIGFALIADLLITPALLLTIRWRRPALDRTGRLGE